MDNLTETLVHSETLYEGKMIKLRFDKILLPDGRGATREVVEHPGAVAVVPILDDGRVVFVRQYRHAAKSVLLEIPAGKLDKNEDPDICALRELKEETGYLAKSMNKLAAVYTTPGFSDELMHLYLAKGLTLTNQQLDEDEFISVEYYTREQLNNMIKSGEISDAKTILGLKLAGI